jgi:hypothetical protein
MHAAAKRIVNRQTGYTRVAAMLLGHLSTAIFSTFFCVLPSSYVTFTRAK